VRAQPQAGVNAHVRGGDAQRIGFAESPGYCGTNHMQPWFCLDLDMGIY
jgi:hypothetical protein